MKRISRGFTIPELLIVVAIIAVLVAIAIPILNKKLEKSREAYDVYTMRQAASVAVDLYYEGIEEAISAGELVWWDQGDAERNNAAGVYNPGAGTFSGIKSENAKRAYGKGTEIDTGATYMNIPVRRNRLSGGLETANPVKRKPQVRVPIAAEPPFRRWKPPFRNGETVACYSLNSGSSPYTSLMER